MKVIPVAFLFILLLGVPALAADPLETLEHELQTLEQELPGILMEDTTLEARQDYVNRVLRLREQIEALEGVADARQCWFRNESAFLYSADPNFPTPPPSECDFYGSCEEAARFAQQKGYGFEGNCEAGPLTATNEEGPRVLQLTNIYATPSFTRDGRFVFNHEPGSAGIDRQESSTKTIHGSTMRDGQDVVQSSSRQESTGFTQFPTTIILGEPFTFQTGLRAKRTKTNSLCGGVEQLRSEAYVRIRRGDLWVRSAFSTLYQVAEVVDEDCAHTPRKHDVSLGGDSTLNVQCAPAQLETSSEPGQNNLFTYQCQVHSDTLTQRPQQNTVSYMWPMSPVDANGNFKGGANGSEYNSRLLISTGFNSTFGPDNLQEVVLEYTPMLKDEPPKDISVAFYSHPFDLQPALQASGDQGEAQPEGEDGKPQEEQELIELAGGKDEAASTGGKEPGRSADGGPTRAGSKTPEPPGTIALHPDNPDVARLIEEWLTHAAPPQNATEGGDFRYNEWGQLVGTAANGGVAAPQSRPDAAIGRTAIEHVWAERDRLDSVDHCTLGEFVEHRLAGENLGACRDRYRPIMPNLVGTPVKRAKSRVEKLGVEVTWQEGSVPEYPAQADTVEKQIPAPGITLKPDQPVELWVYRQAVTMVKVPDVLGMTYRDAAAKLKQAGLQARIGKTSAPLTLAPDQKVQNQETAAGTKVPKGEKIVLNFAEEHFTSKLPPGALSGVAPLKGRLPDFLTPDSLGKDRFKTVRMPDVIGMSYGKAASKLQSLGLTPNRQPGPPAPSRTLAYTVKQAGYAANRVIDAGATVDLTVYGPYRENNEPEAIVKRDPASAFSGPSPGKGDFNCETGIPGLTLQTTGRMYPDRRNGVLKTDVHGEKNYICRYQVKGKQRIALISFFDTPPTTENGKRLKEQMCSVFGLMKNGKNKAVYMTLQNVSLSQSVGKENVSRFYDFHLNQVTPHAISCSGSKKPSPRKPERASSPPRPKNNGRGLDMQTAGSCSQLPPPPSHMRSPTCQCSEANALFGTTTYTNCFWVDKK